MITFSIFKKKMCGDGNDRVVVEMTGCCGNDNEFRETVEIFIRNSPKLITLIKLNSQSH